MPKKLDDQAIFRRFKRLDLSKPKAALARELGISENKFYQLLKLWTAAGSVELHPVIGPRLTSQLSVSTPVLRKCTQADDLTSQKCTQETPLEPMTSLPQDGLTSHDLTSQDGTRPRPDAPASYLAMQEATAYALDLRSRAAHAARAKAAAPQETGKLKQEERCRIHLSNGVKADTMWIRFNAMKLSQEDMATILGLPGSFRAFMKPLAETAGRVMEQKFTQRWAKAHGRSKSHWKPSVQLNAAPVAIHFRKAAMLWAGEYARRGLTMDQFLDAAEEMCPKSMKYPNPSMLCGPWLSERITEWVLPEDRVAHRYDSWTDKAGTQWIQTDDGPVPILN